MDTPPLPPRRAPSSRGGAFLLVGAVAVVFAATVVASTVVTPWHPAQLVVYAYCLVFAVVAGWWLPRRARRVARDYAALLGATGRAAATPDEVRRTARASAAATVLTCVGFFAGLLLFLPVGTLR